MDNFEKNIYQMLYGVHLCLKQNLQFPTLSLIYTLIDNLAYIAYGNKVSVEYRYTEWIKKYMLQENELKVTPLDLYYARCAILHTLTPYSKNHNDGRAYVIAYAWGNKDIKILEQSIINSNEKVKALHINDLHHCLHCGTIKFLQSELLKEKDCLTRINQHYIDIPEQDLENFNDIFRNNK